MTPPTLSTSSPAPIRRHVEQLMGMPVSLALRGRHVTTSVGRDACGSAVEQLREEVDRIFITYVACLRCGGCDWAGLRRFRGTGRRTVRG